MLRPQTSILFFIALIVFLLPFSLGSSMLDSIISSYVRQLQLLLPYFVLLLAIPLSHNVVTAAIVGFVFGNLFAAMYAFMMYANGFIFFGGRLTYSEDYNPTVFGANIASSLTLMIYLVKTKVARPWIWVIIAPVLVLALLLSQSRNALAALALALLLSGFLYLKTAFSLKRGHFLVSSVLLRNTIYTLIVLMVIFVAIFFSIQNMDVDPRFFTRVEATFDSLSGNASATEATANRNLIWTFYLQQDIPFFGLGFENRGALIWELGYSDFPHNSFILTYVQGGVIFFIGYLVFNYFLFREFVRKPNDKNTLIVTALFCFFLNFGNDAYQYTYFWVPLALILGAQLQNLQRSKELNQTRAPTAGQSS